MRPRSRISAQIRAIRKREELAHEPPAKGPARSRTDYAPLPQDQARSLWLAQLRARGWRPFPFQSAAWEAFLHGESGVISVPTGSGKTLAAVGGPVMQMLMRGRKPGIRLLYISPAKALARDLHQSLTQILENLPVRIGLRTGDTELAERRKMRLDAPEILITTPESLILLTSEADWIERFRSLESVVIDEWHELIGSKRGSLLELTLARLRGLTGGLQTWALSATLDQLESAGRMATGVNQPTLIRAAIERPTEISVIAPETMRVWYGSGGLHLRKQVAAAIDISESTILFTNTRSQAELWFRALSYEKPEWEGLIALHHGSLDKGERQEVEDGVKRGEISLVVATSSLDLGVDFPRVKKVIQIGSVKTVARALQRGGRSEHSHGQRSRLVICPTQMLEVLEADALRRCVERGELESKLVLHKPFDVLVQFLLNSALGDGFTRAQIEQWLKATVSFRDVTAAELDWALDFLTTGGRTLKSYNEFKKLELTEGIYRFSSYKLDRLHRFNIGTIVASAGMQVQFVTGKKIGYLDEFFVSRLEPGSVFQFAGRTLELVRIRDMTAQVRVAKAKRVVPAVWGGQILPLSPVIARELRQELSRPLSPLVAPLLELQREESHIPNSSEVLIELWNSKPGFHAFIYLFEGRAVHEGLGHVLAFRLSRGRRNTISVAANEYGLELLGSEDFGGEAEIRAALAPEAILNDIETSLNFPEMVKRTFREIARVAGLIQTSIPGREKSQRQVQMSSGLLFDVLKTYEPDNLLFQEAFTQARQTQLDFRRLSEAVERIAKSKLVFKRVQALTPFSFPLYVERVRSQISTESLEERVERMQRKLFGEDHENPGSG